MCRELHLHILAVKVGAVKLSKLVELALVFGRRLLANLSPLRGGDFLQLLARLAVVGHHVRCKGLHLGRACVLVGELGHRDFCRAGFCSGRHEMPIQ